MSTQELIAAALRVADAFDAKTAPEAWMQQELHEACAHAMVQSDVSEAERLIDNVATSAFASALGEMPSTKCKEARAALLAHIQRGAGIEVGESVTCEQCGHENWIMYGKAPAQITAADMLAAAPAPDHSGDATEMVAEPAEVLPTQAATDAFELWWTNEGQFCRAGGGEYEKTFAFRGYEAGIAASPLRALTVPMPEAVGLRFDGTSLHKEVDVRTYGDAREAAGYARGLKEAGRDAEEIRELRAEIERLRGITNIPHFKPRCRTDLKHLSHDELVTDVIRFEQKYLHRSSMYFHLDQSYEKLRSELETERMRLAACGVVAMSNTPESAAKARNMLPEYRSASCDDVARMVDEQMRLRAELAASRKRETRMRAKLEYALRQNDLDMLLTGDEIRDCRAALAEGAQG